MRCINLRFTYLYLQVIVQAEAKMADESLNQRPQLTRFIWLHFSVSSRLGAECTESIDAV